MQVNPPAAVAVIVDPVYVHEAPPVGVIEIPLKVRTTVDETAKPAPVTVMLLFTSPLDRESEIVQAVTVKEAVAVWPPEASVAVMVPSPASDPAGMATTQVNAPAAVVVIVVPENVEPPLQLAGVIAMLPKVRTTPEETANPVPVTVTLVPMIPLVTDSGEMVHAVTVNGAEAVWPPEASVASIVPTPANDPAGMATTQVNAPAAVVVIVVPENVEPPLQLAGVIAMLPKVRTTPEETANPVPVTVTLVPMTPLVTDSGEMVQPVTVNEAVAVVFHVAFVAVIVADPANELAGTVTTQLNPPVPDAFTPVPESVHVPLEVGVTVTPLNASVSTEEAAK